MWVITSVNSVHTVYYLLEKTPVCRWFTHTLRRHIWGYQSCTTYMTLTGHCNGRVSSEAWAFAAVVSSCRQWRRSSCICSGVDQALQPLVLTWHTLVIHELQPKHTLVKVYIKPGARFSGPQSSVGWKFVRTIPPELGGFGGSLSRFFI